MAHSRNIKVVDPLFRGRGSHQYRWLVGGARVRLASTLSPASAPHPIVISRRAWEAHKRKIPSQPRSKKSKKDPVDDKPWPRSVQIAGYLAATTLIPYTVIWFVVSNPTLREFFGDYLPLTQLRSHFGEVEFDAMSYVDDVDRQEQNVPMDVNYSQFPGEFPYEIRKQQQQIKAIEEKDLKARLYVILNSTSQQEHSTTRVPGSTKATSNTLRSFISGYGTGSISGDSSNNPPVAVDFIDDDDDPGSDSLEYDLGRSLSLAQNESSNSGKSLPALPLLQKTYTYSSWFYQPVQSGQDVENEPKVLSQREVEMSRLEYTIDQLQKDLKDPTCTRDMDDMRAELNQAKSELSRLKWKRRLGF